MIIALRELEILKQLEGEWLEAHKTVYTPAKHEKHTSCCEICIFIWLLKANFFIAKVVYFIPSKSTYYAVRKKLKKVVDNSVWNWMSYNNIKQQPQVTSLTDAVRPSPRGRDKLSHSLTPWWEKFAQSMSKTILCNCQ